MAKDDPTPEAPDENAEAGTDLPLTDEPAKPNRRKQMIIAGAAAAVLAAGGGGAYFFLKGGSSGGDHAAAKPAEAEPAAEAAPAEAPAPAAEGEHAAPAHTGKIEYIALTPNFVVNLNDEEAMRYLQLEIELGASDSSAADAIKLNMPLIRNNLLMIMGQKKYHDLDTREGKERLRAELLEEVQKILTEQTGKPGVDAVYFTSFVMQ